MSLGCDRSCAADAGEVESQRIDRRGEAAGGRRTAKRRQVPRLRASPVGVCSTVGLGDCSRSRSVWSERTPSLAICQDIRMAGYLAAKRSACRALASLSGLEPALLSALIQLLYQPSHRLPFLLVLAIGGQAPQLRGDGGGQVVDLVVDLGGFSTGISSHCFYAGSKPVS